MSRDKVRDDFYNVNRDLRGTPSKQAVRRAGRDSSLQSRSSSLKSKKARTVKSASGSGAKKSKYRLIPIVIAGLILFTLLVLIFGFIWSLVAYFSRTVVEESVVVPALIFYAAVFISAFMLAFTMKGKYLVPVMVFAGVLSVVSLFLGGIKEVSIAGFIIKTLIIFAIAFLANFIMVKTAKPLIPRNRGI